MSITKVQDLADHKDRVWCVAWDPTGNLLASCSGDKTIRIWKKDGKLWESRAILTDGHLRTIRSIAWSPCGSFLASCSFDATTCIWDRRGGEFECVATLEGHENEVKSVSWSSSGQYLATCSRDKSVWIWEVAEDCDYECASVINSHSQDVKRVLWHPMKDVLVSTSYDDTLKIYKDESDDDWVVFDTLKSHTSTVWGASFNCVGSLLASCSDDKTVKIWKEYPPGNPEGVLTVDNDPTWKCVYTISESHNRPVYDVSWCPSTDLIATACGDNSLRVFQQSSDASAIEYNLMAVVQNAHEQDLNSVDWNPKVPGLLATGSDDGIVTLWEVSATECETSVPSSSKTADS